MHMVCEPRGNLGVCLNGIPARALIGRYLLTALTIGRKRLVRTLEGGRDI